MSDTGSASNSPAKGSAGVSTGAVGSLKSRIAAFESGAASNAGKVSQNKAIPHADLSNLRSRFDREGDRPLVVKGSFGLGAPPERDTASTSSGGERAVSLGSGRAVAPTQSPTVILPSPTPSFTRTSSTTSSTAATRASSVGGASISTSSSRPVSLHRSDSTNSASTTTSTSAVTAGSTGSSLLPGPLAAFVKDNSAGSSAASNSSLGVGSDDTGLRTPMSSLSLSSMQVETGSNAGDYSTSVQSGEETANEDDEAGLRTPGEEKSLSPAPPATETFTEPPQNGSDTSLVLSAAELEKQRADEAGAQAEVEAKTSDTSDPEIRPPEEAVARAQKELAEYTKETPADAEIVAPQLALPTETSGSVASAASGTTISPSLSPSASRKKLSSRPNSMSSPKDRLRRSSTSNSLHSQPESDLGDANNLHGADDDEGARKIGQTIAPPASGDAAPSDAPIQAPAPEPVAEVVSAGNADQSLREDDVSGKTDRDVPASVDDGDDADVDEEGMPKVKCSDCGKKVGLMQLGEHVCAAPAAVSPTSPPASGRSQPLDVPTDSVTDPGNSPRPAERDLPERLEAPDVPDDAMSVASIDQAPSASLDNIPTSPGKASGVPNAGEAEEVEEDYQTALTSHRDSIDPSSDRPAFASPVERGQADVPDEEDETEELALGMTQEPAATPRMPEHPDSPTPDQQHVISPTEQVPDLPAKEETPKPNRTMPTSASAKRRSKGNALGDTDSEDEHEPGYATVLSP